MIDEKFFYRALKRRIELSEKAYQNFLEYKNYAAAKTLYNINSEALRFIMDNVITVEKNDYVNITNLILHWQGWKAQFEFEECRNKLNLNSSSNFSRAKGVLPWPSEIKNFLEEKLKNM